MTKANRPSEKEEFWRLVVNEQQASGLSIRRFCQRQQLPEPSFYTWRRTIERRDRERSASQGGESNKQEHSQDAPPNFLPVKLLDGDSFKSDGQDVLRQSSGFEITTRSGMTLRIDESVAVESIRTVLTAMLLAESEVSTC